MALLGAIWFADMGKGTGIWQPLQGLMTYGFGRTTLSQNCFYQFKQIFSQIHDM